MTFAEKYNLPIDDKITFSSSELFTHFLDMFEQGEIAGIFITQKVNNLPVTVERNHKFEDISNKVKELNNQKK